MPAAHIFPLVAACDAGLIAHEASPFWELAQPNKLFEYIALRVPVITARCAAIRESFDESCLMFFEPGSMEELADGIRRLYAEPSLRTMLAENAYRRYESMRWERARQGYLAVVRETLCAPIRRRPAWTDPFPEGEGA